MPNPAHLVHTYDDRGSPVNYHDPLYHGSELDAADRATVNRRKGNRWWAGVPMLIFSLAMLIVVISQLPVSTIVAPLALTLALFAIMWFIVQPLLRRVLWVRRWKFRYIQVGRCPACQYSIASLEPSSDGCTVCPECGGAWRLAK